MPKNIVIPNHPLVKHNLALLRNKDTSREIFLSAFKKISYFLVAEGLKNLPLETKEIETPLATMKTEMLDESYNFIIAPILRAGLMFADTAMELLPQAHILHVGMYRDEETHNPVWYYDKTPKKFSPKTKLILLDPMLATGGSALATVELFNNKGIAVENMVFVSLLSAPEGVEKVHSKFPNLTIITGAVDECLNQNAYIVPGLGDAGDRLFNTCA